MRLADRPRYGVSGRDAVGWLTIYVCLLFFVPSKLVLGPLGSAGAPSMLFGLVSLVLWLVFRVGLSQEFDSGVQPVKIAVYAFLASVGITYVLAMSRPINVDEISPGDVALLATASWTGTMLVAHDGIPSRLRLDTLVWRLVLCGGVIGFLGVVQVLTGRVWVDRISIPGLTLTEVAGTFTRGAFVRPSGTAVHPIEYGVLVTMLLPAALHVAIHHRYRPLLLRWMPAAALGAVIPLTSSRSAYLGVAVGLAIYLAGWPARQRALALVMVLVGIAGMTVVTPNLFRSIVGLFSGASNDPSIASRTGSYDLAGRFIETHAAFGRGLGTFLPKYRIFDNQYLGLLVGVGLIGTALFIALGVVATVCLLRLRRATGDVATRDLALAVAAGIVVAFVGLVMFDAFAFPMTMGAIYLLLGIAGAMCRRDGPLAAVSEPSVVRVVSGDQRRAQRSGGIPQTRDGGRDAVTPADAITSVDRVVLDIAAVIVTYNSERYVGGLLDSLPAAMGELTYSVVVVDNGSTDATVDLLRRRSDCVVVTSVNDGYAAGINRAVRASPPAAGILVLNPDTTLDPGSVERLCEVLRRPGVGVVVPRVREADGSLSPTLRRRPSLGRVGGLSFTGLPAFTERIEDAGAYAHEHEVDWAVGAILLIDRACYEALDGLDESYFLYSEETDFSLRARDGGWATVYTPAAGGMHVGGASGESADTHTMKMVNRIRVYRRRAGAVRAALYFVLLVLTEVRRAFLGHTFSRRTVVALLRPASRPPMLGAGDGWLPR